jgi:hypothetical protein
VLGDQRATPKVGLRTHPANSPRETDWTALLPQPGGFESLPFLQEEANAGELAVLDAHRLEYRLVEKKPTPRRTEMHTEPDEDLVPSGHDSVDVNLHVPENLLEISEVRGDSVRASVDATIGHPRRVVPLKVIAPEGPDGVKPAPVPSSVVPAYEFYVLLRHRPRSISLRGRHVVLGNL